MLINITSENLYGDKVSFDQLCYYLAKLLIEYHDKHNSLTTYDSLESDIDIVTAEMNEQMKECCEEILREQAYGVVKK